MAYGKDRSAKAFEKCFNDGKTPVINGGKANVAMGYKQAKGASRVAIGKRR